MSATVSRFGAAALTVGSMMIAAMPAGAEEWSDTSIGYSYGTKFREPTNPSNVSKNIVNLTHVGGYKYGTNFFNANLLMSDNKDPASGNAGAGAQEVYALYRNTVDFSKVTGGSYKFGFVRDVGVTFGFDYNTKNNGYGSRKRMLVLGPTLHMDVPGFLDVSLFALNESNAPNGINGRYTYKTHAMLDFVWGIPIGDSPFNFQGFCDFIQSKGNDEFNTPTATEIQFNGAVMMDVGKVMGYSKNTFKVGLAYQYWKNKFGDDNGNPFFQGGATEKAPMIRAEYHF
jgi:nucleoside-specific outer membrane channel protein Tsx